MQLIIAEKPSVARDLARVLGVRARGESCFEGEGRVITWCVGHLVELDEPASYDPRWKAWRLDTLPMIPARFQLRATESTKKQYAAVRALLRDKRFGEVVNACDAGREGELIFRYVYELAGSRLPARRLWISSLTDEAIRRGMSELRPSAQLDALADAARCRSEADWLVGMNATRALTVQRRGKARDDAPLYSIGRVQTPTLALLVHREQAIREFVPERYHEVRGRFVTATGERFVGTFAYQKVSRFSAENEAIVVAQRDRATASSTDPMGPRVAALRHKKSREPAPLLFDLTSLQRTANKRYGLSAATTLSIAQALYEKHKLLTYPRTDSRHLTRDLVATLPSLFRSLIGLPELSRFAQRLLERPPSPSPRVFDDSRVQDHHAIIPTGRVARMSELDTDERRIFDLVARRFLGVFFPDAEYALTEVEVEVGAAEPAKNSGEKSSSTVDLNGDESSASKLLTRAPPPPDRYHARGRVRLEAGWKEVAGIADEPTLPTVPSRGAGKIDGADAEKDGDSDEAGEPAQALPNLESGQRLSGTFDVEGKLTRPPPRYTEASLLSAMETAGRVLDDEALRLAMKDHGLGTPATRAATIETLLKREYLTRQKKQLVPTELGMALVAELPVESLRSPELTGAWEERLSRMARRQDTRASFMAEIGRYVREIVDAIRALPPSVFLPVSVSVPVRTRSTSIWPSPSPRVRPTPPTARSTRNAPNLKAGRKTARAPAWDAPETWGKQPRIGRSMPSTPSTPSMPSGAKAKNARKAAAKKSPSVTVAPAAPDLVCPRCQLGALVTGKRGWGCARWREGCRFVIWFEVYGRRLTVAQLASLVKSGKTRTGMYRSESGVERSGRLVLDVNRVDEKTGAVRFIPA